MVGWGSNVINLSLNLTNVVAAVTAGWDSRTGFCHSRMAERRFPEYPMPSLSLEEMLYTVMVTAPGNPTAE